MKKSLILITLSVIMIGCSMPFGGGGGYTPPTPPINCQWTNDAHVYLRDAYLGLPCEECFTDPDFAMISFNFGAMPTNFHLLMEYANQGLISNCWMKWVVSDYENRCSEDTRTRQWQYDNYNYNTYISLTGDELIETPRPIDIDPCGCKYDFECRILLNNGNSLIWRRTWENIVAPNYASGIDCRNQFFYFPGYAYPIVPEVIKVAGYGPRKIYINTQFEEI